MRVIVSNYLSDNYKGYKVVSTFQDVRNLEDVQCLIIHKYSESDFEAGMFLSEFSKKIKVFVYISSNPSITLETMLTGLNGVILKDEFYFQDEEDLNELINEIGLDEETHVSTVNPSASTIREFLKAFAVGSKQINAPIYIEQVNTALTELTSEITKKEVLIKDMGTSAVETFSRASQLISAMSEQSNVLRQQLNDLEESQTSSMSSSPRSNFGGGGVQFYSAYKYTGAAKLLLIREYSPCRYLTSFVLGYANHLKYSLNKRVKTIFVHQKGAGVSARYADICTAITQESMLKDELYSNPVIATNNPKRDVMQKLVQQNDEIIIVVDRLYGSQDIINTRVIKLGAVSGASDLDRFKLDKTKTIFSITEYPDDFLCIPHIKGYAADEDRRRALYNKTCKEQFEKLDSLVLK